MWGKRADMVVHREFPYNAEPARRALADSYVTKADRFYSRNHGPVPGIDVDRWRLQVDGLVATPLSLSLEDLMSRFEERTLTATLQCAGNRRAGLCEVRDIPGEDPWGPGATSTATWTGVRLGDVLAGAGLRDEARHVAFEAPDVLEPRDGATVPAGRTVVRGYAYAGEHRQVARVDVSLDGGTSWVQARLDGRADPWAWRFWACRLDLPPGEVRITVRAWDTTAASQPESPAHLWNPKGYANNSWGQITLTAHA